MPETKIGLLSNFRNRNSRNFFDDIVNEENFVYVFIGRTTPWGPDDEPPDVENTLLLKKTSSGMILTVSKEFNRMT